MRTDGFVKCPSSTNAPQGEFDRTRQQHGQGNFDTGADRGQGRIHRDYLRTMQANHHFEFHDRDIFHGNRWRGIAAAARAITLRNPNVQAKHIANSKSKQKNIMTITTSSSLPQAIYRQPAEMQLARQCPPTDRPRTGHEFAGRLSMVHAPANTKSYSGRRIGSLTRSHGGVCRGFGPRNYGLRLREI